jgi:Zn-dependent M28 family amino/carboxypeptidase
MSLNLRSLVKSLIAPTSLLLALSLPAQTRPEANPSEALASFSGDRMLGHIKTLSSDEFEGRAPGSKGEELSIAYLQKQYRDAGLEPGNPDGTYLQNVPLAGITPDPKMQLTFTGRGKTLALKYQDDFIAVTRRFLDSVTGDGDIIFAGYGVQAPEYHWDDFKDVDVKGKVIVVLINDPPVPDPKIFGGKAMTYYGRWTYKFEKAAELGAAGCIIVHETGPAGYPWEVVRNSWSGEQFELVSADKNMHRAAFESWITHEQAEALFKAAGLDFNELKKKAVSADFHAVPLGMHAHIEIHNTLRTIQSHNVIAKRTGSDPALKNQYVIYTAHWDHLGMETDAQGKKRIYHGAVDNAAGSAALVEIARAYAQLKTPPRCTVIFLSVTAEEQGLLGSEYYAEHPLYPLARTAAEFNMDGMNVWGRTKDIVIVGSGKSTLDNVVAQIAHEQGRTVKPDPEPEKGYYFRSDHFEFAKVGVPAFDPDQGIDYIGKPAGWGLKIRQDYTANDYHKPSDIVRPDWDMTGAVEDAQLFFLAGYRVANADAMPQWKPNAEFRSIREASLKKGGGQ